MRPWRPNVLVIVLCLTAVIVLDTVYNGDPKLALVAAGSLATVLVEIVRKD